MQARLCLASEAKPPGSFKKPAGKPGLTALLNGKPQTIRTIKEIVRHRITQLDTYR